MVTDCGYILACLPENYRLYEHVKKTEKDGKLEVKSKTHAAGGNDRQDAYLYGHPMGRKKRYRSPADFFPHLLWLSTDESGDPDNCSCKLCCPEDLESLGLGAPAKTKAERAIPEQKPAASQPPAPVAKPASAPAVAKPKVEAAAPNPKPTVPVAPQKIFPTPLPQKRSQDQILDSHYRMFLYRPGELVWFRRGQPWGLGVILRRWMPQNQPAHYSVQPLSYPGHSSPAVTKSSDAELRPWLAWSVPRFTNEELNNMNPPPTYENADWQGMANRRYGAGDMEVDGSILAAKAIDASYTPFGKINSVQPDKNTIETRYDGIYLGAEKVWVGEPVRLTIGSGTDIMVVHAIIDRRRLSPTNRQLVHQEVLFQGDVYHLTTVPHSNPAVPSPASPDNNPYLPHRLTQDLAVRNAQSIPIKHSVSFWKLASSQARVKLEDIKGRWYEASILLPILQADTYNTAASKGEVQEASLWMNARGDCTNANRPTSLPRQPRENIWRDTRLAAFGAAVPAGATIRDGTEPPTPLPGNQPQARNSALDGMDIDPRFDTAESIGGGAPSGNIPAHSTAGTIHDNGAGMDAFVDLDGMDAEASFHGQQGHQLGFY